MPKNLLITDNAIINKILYIREQKVMLDSDLAEIFGVTTGNLNKAVNRNIKRFPDDYMFQLTNEEFKILIFQNGISRWGGRRKIPYAFTEHGVLMVANFLKSEIAVEVSLRIIRIFIKLREMLLTHKDILLKLEQIEKNMMLSNERTSQNEHDIQIIFNALKQLINPPIEPREPIGFKTGATKK